MRLFIAMLAVASLATPAAAQRAIVRVDSGAMLTKADKTQHSILPGTLVERMSTTANAVDVVVHKGLRGSLPVTTSVTVMVTLDLNGRPPRRGFASLPTIPTPGEGTPVNPWKHVLEEAMANDPAQAAKLAPLLEKYQLKIDPQLMQRLQRGSTTGVPR